MMGSGSYMNLEEIGMRIRDEREKLGLSREKFAEIVGLSSYYIGQIERGDRNMSLDSLVKIASALNLSIDYLIKGHIHYMEDILALEAFEENYKEEVDREIKEIISLLAGASKEDLGLIRDLIRVILPHLGKNKTS